MRQIFPLILTLCWLFIFTSTSLAQQPVTPSATPPPTANSPDPKVELIKRAFAALNAGDSANANTLLNEFIKQYPDAVEGYLVRSMFRINLRNHAGALVDLNKVLELDPTLGSVYAHRAVERLFAGDAAGALKDFDQAIAHQYVRAFIYEMRSTIRSNQGDDEGALSDLTLALGLNPNSPESYARRAQLWLKFKEGERALSDLNYLLNWYETDPVARPIPSPTTAKASDTGVIHSGGLSFEFDLSPSNPSPGAEEMRSVIAYAYRLRGWLYSQRGESDKAIADLSKAIKIKPDEPAYYLWRVHEYEATGEFENALKDVNLIIVLKPFAGEYLVERAVILKLLGRDTEAQADLDRLATAFPIWRKTFEDRLTAVQKLKAKP